MNKKIIGFLIIIIFLGSSFSVTSYTNSDKLVLIRIDMPENYSELPQDAIVVGQSLDWIDIIIEEFKLSKISNNYELLIYDVAAYDDSVRGVYHTLAEVEATATASREALRYRDIISSPFPIVEAAIAPNFKIFIGPLG